MNELKPCPFCGGKAYLFVDDGVRVICQDCEASTDVRRDIITNDGVIGDSVNAVMGLWNRRRCDIWKD